MEAPVALLRQVRLDLLCAHRATTNDFKAFVASQRYTPSSVDGVFQLRPYVCDELVSALSGDCSKFSRAACETIAGLCTEPKAPKSAAWFVIRSYYAAFYSAHAFLRLFGRTCTNIDGAELAKLKEAASAFNLPLPGKGFYTIKISADQQKLEFKKLKNSHEDTWATLYAVLDELREAAATIAAPKASRDTTVQILSDIRDTMSCSGRFENGNYLSFVRNQVQYRFAEQTWYPYGSKAFPPPVTAEEIAKSVLEGRYQRLAGSNELIKFVNASLEFVQLTLSLIDFSAGQGASASTHLHRDYKHVRNMYA
ncbi:hypothetical protein RSK20926_11724 [Roseobacter sp. SK209-2-6]|uniref:hypothetical protein n=1 Tax=Roseobacter sp. SK209-2-6 TaxID=388739 RepID=UPI0000F3C77E|nr:hypothetical protein [Roseobacter sp. SK209-2-6]EBA18386.1 hypothetical protein RSK20926_11724 [Roseobacter sp. SK209-2-6]